MRASLLLVVAGCAYGREVPRPHVKATFDAPTFEYAVAGSTADELTTSLRTRAKALLPELLEEQHFGQHAWTVKTAWTPREGEAGCAAAEIRIEAISAVVVPRWEAPEGADSGLVDVWDCYSDALTTHEEGHRAIARAGLDDLVAAMGELVPVPTCEAMGEAIDDLREDVMSDVRARQKAYDDATDHGRDDDCT